MSKRNDAFIVISIGRREALGLLAAALLLAGRGWLASESLTMTTTYPSPAGIYKKLVTTGAGNSHTVLSRDSGNVGIGTTSPGQKLQVSNGNLLVQGPQNYGGSGNSASLYVGDTWAYVRAIYGTGLQLGVYGHQPLMSLNQTGTVVVSGDLTANKVVGAVYQ